MPRKIPDNAVADFAQALGLFVRRLRAASASHEISWTQTAVMGRLAREGPSTIADLARAEGMKPQSMGATVAALEEIGIVERKPHPTDGRQVHIALTAKGAAIRDSVRAAKLAWLEHAIAHLDEQEQKILFAAANVIKRLAES